MCVSVVCGSYMSMHASMQGVFIEHQERKRKREQEYDGHDGCLGTLP